MITFTLMDKINTFKLLSLSFSVITEFLKRLKLGTKLVFRLSVGTQL
jgi:hypothetical protein